MSLGCDSRSPIAPAPSSLITFDVTGRLDQSCEVISFQACETAAFGSGIAAGTSVSGRISIDPETPQTVVLKQDNYSAVRYFGVRVSLTVGSVTLSGNDPASTYVEIDSMSNYEQDVVTIMQGFPSGKIAGLSIDFAQIALPVTPSRFPDVSLVKDPSVFQAGIGGPKGASILIKHHTRPEYSIFGIAAPGPVSSGPVTSIVLH